MKKMWVTCLTCLCILTLLLTGCGGKDSPDKADGKSGGTLVFGLSAEPKTLDPVVNVGYAGRNIGYALYRGLFGFDNDGKVVNALCDSYEMAKDGLTYTFKLKNATFHNGDPVTAEDVKYTFEHVMDPKVGACYQGVLSSSIVSIETPDSKTVVVHMKQPLAPFVSYLATKEMCVLSKKWSESHNINTEPMGAGPFQFVSWDRGQSLIVKRFDKFYDSVAKLDEIEFKFYPDENARVTALKTKEANIIDYVPAEQFQSIENNSGTHVDKVEGPFMIMTMNVNMEPFNNPKVREAMCYAIDRDAVIKTAFAGQGTPLFGAPVMKGSVAYDPAYTNYYSYDPEKAKAILTEAGYPNGFTFKLACSSTYKFNEQTAVAVQAALKKIGVTAELVPTDWTTFFAGYTGRTHQASVNGMAGEIPDPDALSVVYSAAGKLNGSGYNGPAVEELFKKGRGELDDSKRGAVYKELEKTALADSPFVPLMWRMQAYALTDNVKGFVNLPNGMFSYAGYTLNQVYLSK